MCNRPPQTASALHTRRTTPIFGSTSVSKNYVIFVAVLTLVIVTASVLLMHTVWALLPLATLPLAAWVASAAKMWFWRFGNTHRYGAFSIVFGGVLLIGLGAWLKVEALWAIGFPLLLVQGLASCADLPRKRPHLA